MIEYTEDDQAVRVVEGRWGLRTECECGWQGTWRLEVRCAQSDMMDHALVHSFRVTAPDPLDG